MKVLLACERSGGHIFPALVLGKKIRTENCPGKKTSVSSHDAGMNHNVYFFVTASFLKKKLTDEGFIVYGRSFSFRNLFLEGFYRFGEAIYLLIKIRPQQVIGFGGRDSFFLILLASLLRIDTVIYDPNRKLGKANRVLSFFVRKVWCGFPETVKTKKMNAIGIPLRDTIRKIRSEDARKMLGFDVKPVILCVGGSQGASFVNKIFLKLVGDMKGQFQIIHLTGKREYLEVSPLYNKISQKNFVKDFYYEMELLYSASDVVISRAGALTLAEISYYQIPSILIPHPQAGGHQKHNADYLKQRGAAFVFTQDNFSFEEFKTTAERLLYDSCARQKVIGNFKNINIAVPYADFAAKELV